MSKFKQGIYKVKNPKKYIGKKDPMMRSSWEFTVAAMFDNNPNILEWASEPFGITYYHPFKKRKAQYWPDFYIKYKDKNGNILQEVIEVKPKSQSILKEGMNQKAKATVILNLAKWQAAKSMCQQRGVNFRVITEFDIYRK